MNRGSSVWGKQEVFLSTLINADEILNEINYQGSEDLIMNDRTKLTSIHSQRYKSLSFVPSGKEANKLMVLSSRIGVGKSILSFFLANLISKSNARVLLVNLNQQNSSIRSWIDNYSENQFEEHDQSYDHHTTNETIVSLSHRLDFMDYRESKNDIHSNSENMIEYFKAIFRPFASEYDYILFDTQTGLNELNLAVLENSDKAILVSTPDFSSISDIYSLIKASSSFLSKTDFCLVINYALEQKTCIEAHKNLNFALRSFMNCEIKLLGIIPSDDILKSLATKSKVLKSHPAKFPALKNIERIAQTLLSEQNQYDRRNVL